MPRFQNIWFSLLLSAAMMPSFVAAQDDPNERPLGDVARSLRKESATKGVIDSEVIDDDNLSQVMEQAASKHSSGSALTFLMAGESRNFRVASPDVTCSLSFRANTKSLLSNQYAQMELPASDMLKLSGPATIEGNALTIPVFNGTAWHVSEIAVALTVVTGHGTTDALAEQSEVQPEKKPDTTVIFKMRAAAGPSTVTVFSAPLNLDLSREEWHWAIVQAKGYPPQEYPGITQQETAKTSLPPSTTVPRSLLLPQQEPASALTPNPQ